MNNRYANCFLKAFTVAALFTFVGSARAGDTCGDNICGASETYCDCPADCTNDPNACEPCECTGPGGDSEDCYCDDLCVSIGDCCFNACQVCGRCGPVCGDGACESGEDCFFCPQDCGDCGVCGDGSCDFFEFCFTCEADCGVCSGACCLSDNTVGFQTVPCEDTTLVACTDIGGAWQGPFSSCGSGSCEPQGACCLDQEESFNVAGGKGPIGCTHTSEIQCLKGFGGEFLGVGTECGPGVCNPERVDISKKGSLLIFSDVELEYTESPVAGTVFNVTKDTIISLTNDYPGEVYVQMYFVNGDPEQDAVFSSGPLPVLISEQEPGCNWVDCAVLLTPDQSVYWSAASGNPVGCQPFGILDPDLGNGPGRPNPDVPGGPRVIRGFIVAWAVDANGREINWNHLSGKATIVDYAAQAAWEYSPWAFQAVFGEHGSVLDIALGVLIMDGFKYASAFDMLLFDFFAAGSAALSSDGNVVSVDTDLTLHPVSHDLRQEHQPPVTTKAHFDIWNMNERKLSNTRRCITCWDQVLLSRFGAPNNFLLMNLQSDKGKARIDGKQADECDENCFRDMLPDVAGDNQTAGFLGDLLDLDFVCSQDAALLGVAAKILRFGDNSIDYAGSELVGMGTERAYILYDIVGPPGTLREDTYNRIRPVPSKASRIDGSGRGK